MCDIQCKFKLNKFFVVRLFFALFANYNCKRFTHFENELATFFLDSCNDRKLKKRTCKLKKLEINFNKSDNFQQEIEIFVKCSTIFFGVDDRAYIWINYNY